MSVDREELKRMIDQIPEQDALEVFDFIGKRLWMNSAVFPLIRRM